VSVWPVVAISFIVLLATVMFLIMGRTAGSYDFAGFSGAITLKTVPHCVHLTFLPAISSLTL
jgi:hypothetical protein